VSAKLRGSREGRAKLIGETMQRQTRGSAARPTSKEIPSRNKNHKKFSAKSLSNLGKAGFVSKKPRKSNMRDAEKKIENAFWEDSKTNTKRKQSRQPASHTNEKTSTRTAEAGDRYDSQSRSHSAVCGRNFSPYLRQHLHRKNIDQEANLPEAPGRMSVAFNRDSKAGKTIACLCKGQGRKERRGGTSKKNTT